MKRSTKVGRGLLPLAALTVIAIVVASTLLWLPDDGNETFSGVPATDPGPVHVHGPGRSTA